MCHCLWHYCFICLQQKHNILLNLLQYLFIIFYIEIHTDYRHYEGNIIFRKKISTRKAQAILKTPPFYSHFRFELKWLNVTFLAEQKR